MSPCAAPECGGKASTKCRRCGAMLCRWHYALSPIKSAKDVQPVCFPECRSDYWKEGCNEVKGLDRG